MWGCKPPKSSNLFLSANNSALLGRTPEALSGACPDPVLPRTLPRTLPRKRQQTSTLRIKGDAADLLASDVVGSDDPATWARVEAIVVAVRALVGGGMAAQTIPLLDELAALIKRARGPLAQVIPLGRSRPSRRR